VPSYEAELPTSAHRMSRRETSGHRTATSGGAVTEAGLYRLGSLSDIGDIGDVSYLSYLGANRRDVVVVERAVERIERAFDVDDRDRAPIDFAPHRLGAVALVNTPCAAKRLHQPKTAPRGRLIRETPDGGAYQGLFVGDFDPKRRSVVGDRNGERGACVNDGIGRKLADDLHDSPVVVADAGGVEYAASKAARVGDAARYTGEVDMSLVHAHDPINDPARSERPVGSGHFSERTSLTGLNSDSAVY
jgi:hypothetical protein